jgi:hypothetical protein
VGCGESDSESDICLGRPGHGELDTLFDWASWNSTWCLELSMKYAFSDIFVRCGIPTANQEVAGRESHQGTAHVHTILHTT